MNNMIFYLGGRKITDIAEIKNGIDLVDLAQKFYNGTLEKWLAQKDEKYRKDVASISKKGRQDEIKRLCKVFSLACDICMIREQSELDAFLSSETPNALIIQGSYSVKSCPLSGVKKNLYALKVEKGPLSFWAEKADGVQLKIAYSAEEIVSWRVTLHNIQTELEEYSSEDIYIHGKKLYCAGSYGDAIRQYKRVEGKIQAPRFYIDMADAYGKKGDLEKAVSCLDKLPAASTFWGEAKYKKYELYQELGNEEKANQCLKEAASYQYPAAICVYAKKLLQGGKREQKEAFELLKGNRDTNGDTLLLLADCFLNGKGTAVDLEEARKCYQQAVELLGSDDGKKSAAYKGLGEICEKEKNMEQAAMYFLMTTDPISLLKAAEFYKKSREVNKAVEAYERAYGCGEKDAYYYIAELLFDSQDPSAKDRGKAYVIQYTDDGDGDKEKKKKILNKYLKYYRKIERDHDKKDRVNTNQLERIASENGIQIKVNAIERDRDRENDPTMKRMGKIGNAAGAVALALLSAGAGVFFNNKFGSGEGGNKSKR